MGSARKRPLFWCALFTVLVLAFYALRLAGPSNLEADAQDRNVGYVMDTVWQGHWLVQQDIRGRIMSKPPLHTWITAAFAELGGINRLTLTLTSMLAVLAMAFLVFLGGRQRLGVMAGGLAGLAVVLAPMMSKQVALVRTDALFALAVALGALAAHRAWERGGGWLPFWLGAAAATLIKGPLGLVRRWHGVAGLVLGAPQRSVWTIAARQPMGWHRALPAPRVGLARAGPPRPASRSSTSCFSRNSSDRPPEWARAVTPDRTCPSRRSTSSCAFALQPVCRLCAVAGDSPACAECG
ncbi:MAG: glycosyltransferase family 39 protein [Rhodocyclaceae bacterium]|nr:glycosyltransferase family 39 protein [Rhodocyclaceae bacterium]